MTPLKILEHDGQFSLLLNAGTTKSDDLIEEMEHEPNGYFWEGVAMFLLKDHPSLRGRFEFDPEGGMFCAYGTDREALEQLGSLMAAIANDPAAAKTLIEKAHAAGHEFDD